MYGVSKLTSEPNMMLITFPGAQYTARSMADYLEAFAQNEVVLDMICQSAPRGTEIDFSFTASSTYFATVMKTIPRLAAEKGGPGPLISGGYVKVNLFGEEMVSSCGVAARALAALAQENIEVALITTSDLDISLLLREEHEDTALTSLARAFAL